MLLLINDHRLELLQDFCSALFYALSSSADCRAALVQIACVTALVHKHTEQRPNTVLEPCAKINLFFFFLLSGSGKVNSKGFA